MSQLLRCKAVVICLVVATGCATTTQERNKGGLIPFLPVSVVDEAHQPRRFALLIGINCFDDPRWSPLKYAEKDAHGMSTALQGFERQLMVGKVQTRRANILAEMDSLAQRANRPEDIVLVYISSHGTLARRPGQGLARYVVAADTRKRLVTETGLSIKDLLRSVERIPSQRKAVILSLCHSGAGKSSLPDELAKALANAKADLTALQPIEQRSEATFLLTACAFGETARESDQLGHDIYTYFLLESLSRGDLNEDGAVTATEAHSYARVKTYDYTQGEQRPTKEGAVIGVDPIVLAGKRVVPGRPILYSASPSAEGIVVVLDGRIKGELVEEIPTEEGTHKLELMAGPEGKVLYSGEVELVPGERVEVSHLIPPRPRICPLAELGIWTPLSSSFRQRYRPLSLAMTAGLRIDYFPWRWAFFEALVNFSWGGGETPGVSQALHSEVTEIGVLARFGYLLSQDWLTLLSGIQIRTAKLYRQVESATFQSNDSAWLGAGGLFAAIGFQPIGELEVGANLALEMTGMETDGQLRFEPALFAMFTISLPY